MIKKSQDKNKKKRLKICEVPTLQTQLFFFLLITLGLPNFVFEKQIIFAIMPKKTPQWSWPSLRPFYNHEIFKIFATKSSIFIYQIF
jgi:hypothetical protein